MVLIQEVIVECPFCGKKAVKSLYYPPSIRAKTSRISAGSKTKFYRISEIYEIVSGCSKCGKSQEEVEKAFREAKSDVKREKKILKRLKEQGLFSREIVTKP